MAFTMTVAEVIAADTSGLLSSHGTWERVPLADIAVILNGAPFDSSLFNTNEGTPLVRIRDVLTGETFTYYTGSYEDLFVVNQGDLLIGMDGDFNCGLWGKQIALLNQRVCKVTPNESYYDKRFLTFALPGYLSAINANTPSVTVKHLSSRTIGEIDLPLPPRTEQTRIVEKLEELFSDLDAGVAELKAAQKKLAQYRQSLLKSAVEGVLTAEWRKKKGPLSPTPLPQGGEGLSLALKTPLAPCGRGAGGEGETGAQLLARILKERRVRWEEKQLARFKEQGKTLPKGWQDKYPEPVQPDTSNLPELPEGWVWASLDQLSEIQGGIQKQPSRKPMVNNYPFLRVANVLRGRLKLDDVHEIELFSGELERLRLQKGDILIVEGNGSINEIGRCALWNGSIENTVHQNHLIRSRPIVISSEFVEAWLNSLHGIDLITKLAATTSGLYTLSVSKIAKVPVPVPPIDEQIEAIDILSNAMIEADLQIIAVHHSLTQAAAQRKNILKSAFSGQLVQQDPNDEPASVLLERIRAERQQQTGKPKPGRRLKKQEAAQ